MVRFPDKVSDGERRSSPTPPNNFRGVFRSLLNIYDGAFLQK